MNGKHVPTTASQIKEAELNVHKESSQLNLHFYCVGAAVNQKLVFDTGHQVSHVSHHSGLMYLRFKLHHPVKLG